MILTMAGAAAFGLIAAAFYLRKHWRRPESWVVAAFLLMGWAILVWQIRGATTATTAAIPFSAWAVAMARRRYRQRATAMGAVAFVGILATSSAAAWASAGTALQARITDHAVMQNYEARVTDTRACGTPAAYRSLAAAPKGVMLNQFALGAGVLVWTNHSVLAGPYHRDVTGTLTMIEAFRSSPDEAKAIVIASAADYVLVCAGGPESSFYARHAADNTRPDDTLSAMLGRHAHPDWLEPVKLEGSPLSLYRVVR
jgi:hypothetical protein